MDLKTTLEAVGLSEKESKIYLVLLELKEALPGLIAKKADVKRPTTYLILEQLVKRGLASKIKKGAYYYFQPVNPNSLLEDQYNKYTQLEKALPELLHLHSLYAVKPQVSFFEGKDGIIRIMEDTLKTKTELLCWADASLATGTLLRDYYPSYIKTKVKRGIWLRGIFSYDKTSLKLKKTGGSQLREVHLIPKEKFPFKNEINIYDDKISIVSHRDHMGVIIENKNIADTQRSIFNFAFEYAKIVEKEILSDADLIFLNEK